MQEDFYDLAARKPSAQRMVREFVAISKTTELPTTQSSFLEDLRDVAKGGPLTNNLDKTERFSIVWVREFYERAKALSDTAVEQLVMAARAEISGESATNPNSSVRNQFDLHSSLKPIVQDADINLKEFAKLCIGPERGHYLMVRLPAADRIIVSEMSIDFDVRSRTVPTFRNEQYEDGYIEKVTEGIILKVKGAIHAVEGVEGADVLRTMTLNYVTRPERTDLYGIRTGVEPENRRLYAHLVYLYQLSDERDELVKENLRSGTPEQLFEKAASMDLGRWDRIVDYLTPSEGGGPGVEYGFQPKAIR